MARRGAAAAPVVRYTPNSAEWARYLLGPEVGGIVAIFTAGTAAHARAMAPVDSGEYRGGIVTEWGREKDRWTGHVVATAGHSATIEWGNSTGRRGHHVLRRAKDAVVGG